MKRNEIGTSSLEQLPTELLRLTASYVDLKTWLQLAFSSKTLLYKFSNSPNEVLGQSLRCDTSIASLGPVLLNKILKNSSATIFKFEKLAGILFKGLKFYQPDKVYETYETLVSDFVEQYRSTMPTRKRNLMEYGLIVNQADLITFLTQWLKYEKYPLNTLNSQDCKSQEEIVVMLCGWRFEVCSNFDRFLENEAIAFALLKNDLCVDFLQYNFEILLLYAKRYPNSVHLILENNVLRGSFLEALNQDELLDVMKNDTRVSQMCLTNQEVCDILYHSNEPTKILTYLQELAKAHGCDAILHSLMEVLQFISCLALNHIATYQLFLEHTLSIRIKMEALSFDQIDPFLRLQVVQKILYTMQSNPTASFLAKNDFKECNLPKSIQKCIHELQDSLLKFTEILRDCHIPIEIVNGLLDSWVSNTMRDLQKDQHPAPKPDVLPWYCHARFR